MLGGSATRIAAGYEALALTPPRGPPTVENLLTFARIHQYLSMAAPLLWMRQADTIGVLGLALNACDERSNGHRDETERIRELLTTARDLWRLFPEADDEAERVRTARVAFRLVHLANITAVTSHCPSAPSLPVWCFWRMAGTVRQGRREHRYAGISVRPRTPHDGPGCRQ